MRRALASLTLSLIIVLPASAAPDFVPKPKLAFEGFEAINPPRADVPVGALWVDGYGATGDRAEEANIETVRSLSGANLEKELQLNLSAAVLQLVGIDPRYRDRYTARFTDLSVLRIKDAAKLKGPPGELRILEALKAGTISVSTDGDAGLNAQTLLWGPANSDGNLTSGRRKAYGIEGRDMIIAIKVGRLTTTSGKERKIGGLEVGETVEAQIDGASVLFRRPTCESEPNNCQFVSVSAAKSAQRSERSDWKAIPNDGTPLRLALPVPAYDGRGGLYDEIEVKREPCAAERCHRAAKLVARVSGRRIEIVKPRGSHF